MKVLTVVGARPQFIKAAAVSRELQREHDEFLVHTGQHYDYEMSGIFFEGLGLREPNVNLAVGSGSHGAQTAAMLSGLEKVLIGQAPDCLLVYGDTNSTLAAALAASKLSIPICHVEAGLRSFNRRMPEEINRVVTDHLSALLLCPSSTAVENLYAEGIERDVHLAGDVMLDVLLWARERTRNRRPEILRRLGLDPRGYVLVTIHRGENTDDTRRFSAILHALNSLAEPVILSLHPRTRRVLAASGHTLAQHVHVIDPVGYLEMTGLTALARLVMTDSGGLQKEAYWLKVPCVTLRDETEWVETVKSGWNTLVGSDSRMIVDAARSAAPAHSHPSLYGDGSAAKRCVALLPRLKMDRSLRPSISPPATLSPLARSC